MAKQKEHIIEAVVAAPFRTVHKTYKHLSGGGFGLIAAMLSAYCAGLSIESIYVATPSFIGDEQRTQEELRFIPKPYVEDGAKLGRLSPVVFQLDFMGSWVNPLESPKGPVKWNAGSIWENPGVLVLAIAVSLTIQQFEQMVLRRKSFQQTKASFDDANGKKRVTADKNAVAEAKLAAARVNNHGTGTLLIKTLGVSAVYALEAAAFASSFAGAGFAISIVYGFLTIAGFEVFDLLSEEGKADLKGA